MFQIIFTYLAIFFILTNVAKSDSSASMRSACIKHVGPMVQNVNLERGGYVTTERSFRTISMIFNNASTSGINGNFPPFKVEDFITGDRSILSMGEGGSNFIKILLKKAARKRGRYSYISNIHAVDVAYQNPTKFIPSSSVVKFIKEHPHNYHAASFENLDLRWGDGKLVQFDEIISSFSLYLTVYNNPRLIEMLILLHLKPMGVMRLYPFGNSNYAVIKPTLEKMYKNNLISNYSAMEGKYGVMLIKKSSISKAETRDYFYNKL